MKTKKNSSLRDEISWEAFSWKIMANKLPAHRKKSNVRIYVNDSIGINCEFRSNEKFENAIHGVVTVVTCGIYCVFRGDTIELGFVMKNMAESISNEEKNA